MNKELWAEIEAKIAESGAIVNEPLSLGVALPDGVSAGAKGDDVGIAFFSFTTTADGVTDAVNILAGSRIEMPKVMARWLGEQLTKLAKDDSDA